MLGMIVEISPLHEIGSVVRGKEGGKVAERDVGGRLEVEWGGVSKATSWLLEEP